MHDQPCPYCGVIIHNVPEGCEAFHMACGIDAFKTARECVEELRRANKEDDY